MTVLEMRRMVMAQMAAGAQFVKGSFTVPNDASKYTINFGKSFSKYILFIEADSTSKQTILDSGINASRAYAVLAIYPTMTIGETSAHKYVYNRIHTINKTVTLDGNNNGDKSVNSVELPVAALTGSSTNGLFRGLTYGYYIVEIK